MSGTDDSLIAWSARRLWLVGVAAAVAVGWAGIAGYALWWKFSGEWSRAEALAAPGRPLTDDEFEWALDRIDHEHAAVARHAETAVVQARLGPERVARVEAMAGPLLDTVEPHRRIRGLSALLGVGMGRPPADPLRQKLVATAIGLLDSPNGPVRMMGIQAVGFLGGADHLPRLRPLTADPDATNRRLTAEAIGRIEERTVVGPPAPGAADARP